MGKGILYICQNYEHNTHVYLQWLCKWGHYIDFYWFLHTAINTLTENILTLFFPNKDVHKKRVYQI